MTHLVVTMRRRENWVFQKFILHRQIFSKVWILLNWPLMHGRDVWIPFGDMWGVRSVFVWVCARVSCHLLRWDIFLQGRTEFAQVLDIYWELKYLNKDAQMNEWNEIMAKPAFLGAPCWFAHYDGIGRDLCHWIITGSWTLGNGATAHLQNLGWPMDESI